jgi:hypothetical protein
MVFSVALQRQLEAMKADRPNRYGANGDGLTKQLEKHIEGAGGELAFAKTRGLYWNGSVNTYRDGGDVGAVQVRTRLQAHYDLIVRESDRDEDWFVLMIGQLPVYRFMGYIRGIDAKRDEWLADHGGHGRAWFVPQDALKEAPSA